MIHKRVWQHAMNLGNQLKTRNSFVQNSAFMFFSSGAAMLVQFLFFPILSRIYSPEVYGIFGVFNFYVSVVGNSASLSYNQAIVLPHEQKDFRALLKLNVWITILFTSVITMLCFIAGPELMRVAKTEVIGSWVYLIGPVAFVFALNRIMVEWTMREQAFRKVTSWSTGNMIVNKLFNVGYGKFVEAGVTGLVLTNVLLYSGQVFFCSVFIIRDCFRELFAGVPFADIKESALRYKNYPKYIFWGNTVNLVSSNIPTLGLPLMGFGLKYVGYFNYSMLLLDLPVRLMGAGISSVFLPKAKELNDQRFHELAPATWKLFRMMLLISASATAVIFIFGEPLYKLLFGSNWSEAGRAAEILAVYYFFLLLSSPLTVLFNVLKKESQFLGFQVVLFITRIGILVLGSVISHDFIEVMTYFSFANAVCYLWLCMAIFKATGINRGRGLMWILGSCAMVFGIGFLMKTWIF